ncbi:MAG: hypothetical protein K2M12_07475, partial [Muribaculaceae bacterium]|nr:hypothetical protein [Muribaculaceae bacterium]
MKLNLLINYHTEWGETLHVCGNARALGLDREEFAPAMTPLPGSDRWALHTDIEDGETPLAYRYLVVRDGRVVRHEWGLGHKIEVAPHTHGVRAIDSWCDMPDDKPLYASAFTKCVFKRNDCAAPVYPRAGKVMIEVEAPQIAPDQVVAICGSTPSMESWNVAKAVRMSDAAYPLWRACVDERDITEASEFKFVVLRKTDGALVAWEPGENRRMDIDPETGEATIVAGLRLRNPFGHWRGAGVAIPVFSIR